MIAAMAMIATVACGEKDPVTPPPVDPTAPKATIVAAPTSVKVDGAGAFNVTLDKAAAEDVTIAVANGGADFLTVAAAEIKITKGQTTGTVAFTGKAEGSAKVTFSTTSTAISLETKELSVAVTEKPVVGPEYSYPDAAESGTYGSITNVVIGTTDNDLTKMDVANMDLAYWNFFVETPVRIATGDKLVVKFDIGTGYGDAAGSSEGDPYAIDVYADWNNDGKFDGANESLGKETFTGNTPQVKEYTLTIPEGAVASRIRVIYAFDGKSGGAPYVANESFDTGAVAEFMYSL